MLLFTFSLKGSISFFNYSHRIGNDFLSTIDYTVNIYIFIIINYFNTKNLNIFYCKLLYYFVLFVVAATPRTALLKSFKEEAASLAALPA